ncbi:MAG: ACP S-malonyltransferase, partial [Nocardiopsaceae bacterium]|nr:ACP S-malonyltransferase [Nocardiopsaceae bacterium]
MLRLAAADPAGMAALLAAPDSELLARAGTEPAGSATDGATDSATDRGAGDGPGDWHRLPCRLAIVAPDARRLALARKVAARGRPWRGRSDLWFTPSPLLRGPEQVAFLFPGFEPEFAPRIEGVAGAFGLPEPRLRAVAAAGHGDGVIEQALDVIAVSRLYAAALAGLGIAPGALAGHSLGEWTAMVAAGIYPEIDEFTASLRPGMVEVPDLVYLALGASAARAVELTGGLDGVVLTHDNCPRQSVVCGPAARIAEAGELARDAGILAQVMPFRTGFHSPAFAPYTEPLRRALSAVEVRPPSVPVWSATTVSPFPRDPGAIRDLVLRHLVEPVRFRQLTELLHEEGIRAFVQVGPGSLTGFTGDTLDGREFITVATATSRHDGLGQLRRAAAALWAEGLSPDFRPLAAPGLAAPGFGRPASPDPGRPDPDRERLAAPGFERLAGSADRGRVPSPEPGSERTDGRSRPEPRSKPVRLRLGSSFVRIGGMVPPLAGGGAIPVTTIPPFGLVGAELNALLTETAAAAQSVAAALSAPV